MDIEQFNTLFQYLSTQTFPPQLNQQQKQQLEKQSKYFILKDNFIYKKDRRKEGRFLRLIKKNELEQVLYMFHNDPTAAHFATDAMFEKIRTRYYWPQMYENIRDYVRTCDACQRRGGHRKNQLLHPIPVGNPFHQIGMDFVGPLTQTPRGNKYIIVAMDHFTKWPEAKPVPNATADQVALFLYEDIVSRHGCPVKILTDQGTHFRNNMIKLLMEKFKIRQKFSAPYHPQTNGMVERFNRTLCESLAKLSNDHKDDWDLYIAPTLFAYRTSKHNTTQITPFYLLYGRDAKLPMNSPNLEGEHTLVNRIDNLLEDLPLKRNQAKERIEIAQLKQKEMYDRKIKHEDHFDVGQKVLYYYAPRDNQHTGKLLPKWKGPYLIHRVGPHGSYHLQTLEGKLFRSLVNGTLLKIYNEPEITPMHA